MKNKEIIEFIEAIQRVENSSEDATLDLMVKYAWDKKFYGPQWPLPVGDYITETGLLDPGFGQGPTDFSDIEVIRVHTIQAYHQMSEKGYIKKVARLKEIVTGLKGVKISQKYIEFTNRGT
jgi:hypothetical protein